MLKHPNISYRNSRPLKDYRGHSKEGRLESSPLRVKTGNRSPAHDRINSSYIPRRMQYHKLAPALADKRAYQSSSNLDLPLSSSEKKQDDKPNWLSMRTGGQFSKYELNEPSGETDDLR